MSRIDPDLARRTLPAQVEILYQACYLAEGVLAIKANFAPSSAEAKAFNALRDARRGFHAWLVMSGAGPQSIEEPTDPTIDSGT